MKTTALKKNLSITLALLTTGLTLTSFASCADSGNAAPVQDTTASETSASETAAAEPMPELPDKDFGGADFLFLTSGIADTNNEDWQTYDFYAEAENGDIINDAVYARNLYISETYNTVIGCTA